MELLISDGEKGVLGVMVSGVNGLTMVVGVQGGLNFLTDDGVIKLTTRSEADGMLRSMFTQSRDFLVGGCITG